MRPTLVPAAFVLALVAACAGQEPPPKPPAPPPPRNDPALLGQVAQACARLVGCSREAARFREPGACVDWWLADADAAHPDPLRKCLVEATTCEQVATCMRGGGDARAAAFCGQRQGVVSGCDGDRLVSCGEDDGHESNVVDCAGIGASCREVKASGGLVVRACWSSQKCAAGVQEGRCEGANTVVTCRDGAFERVSCRPGTACEERKDEMGDRFASCELAGRSGQRRCDLGGVRHCEGDRLVECERATSKVRVTDCVGLGLHCAGVGPRAGCVVANEVECDRELLPKCEGAALAFCAAGRLAKVSCSAIGLGVCDPSAKGPIAGCVPKPTPASPAVAH